MEYKLYRCVAHSQSSISVKRALLPPFSLSLSPFPSPFLFFLMNFDLSIAGHIGGSFVAAQCRSMPASCSAWWGVSETPRRSASIAAICVVARQQSVERRRKRRRRRRDRRSTGSTELDTSDRWARGGMGARRWAHLPGCRGPSRLPRPPPPRPPPLSANRQSVVSAACRMRPNWRMRTNHRNRRRAVPGQRVPLPNRPRRGPLGGAVSRHPIGPFGHSSAWPSRIHLGRCASVSWNGSILFALSLIVEWSKEHCVSHWEVSARV